MDKFSSVCDLADTCSVTPRTVRLYIEKKLLSPKRVGRSFIFTAESIDQVQTILRDKCIGLSLDEIKSRLEAKSAPEFKRLIARVDNVILAAHQDHEVLCKPLSQSGQHRS
ncbi:MAG: MerR family transcriptional regulator [Magnetovibrio sp.]|nr:MerR family transcriptional regulator [Magnetovibrio sp.]